jgi:hypothetical protein
MEVRAFRVVIIPALAIETVCCSYDVRFRSKVKAGHRGTYHNFVQNTAGGVRHLVKFVNATYTAIAQDKSTTERRGKIGNVRQVVSV